MGKSRTMWTLLVAGIVVAAMLCFQRFIQTERGAYSMQNNTPTITDTTNLHEIYLAGGCFWGTEGFLKKLPGVTNTQVGYANGLTENPTYEEVCRKDTGFAETVHVQYDTAVITTEQLLKGYFLTVDPTLINRQGGDIGSQYRTGIYYTDEADVPIIETVLAQVQKGYTNKIVTEVTPLVNYYPAEDYHQDYLDKNPNGYCHVDLGQADQFAAQEGLENKPKTAGNIADAIAEKGYTVPSQEELQQKLTDLQYRVTQNAATEPPHKNEYDQQFDKGIYVDIVTGEPLFTSLDKFDAGCGWPSFSKPLTEEVVTQHSDTAYGMSRVEVRSKTGDSHLGHVFEDGPQESGGLRYCINSASLRFIPYEALETEGYGYLKQVFEP